MAPFDLLGLFGKFGMYAIYIAVGIGFGVALEMSGFSVSTKLTGQFYLRDQTVFQVMFTGVIVAMVLVFGAAGLGFLDINRIWVPETYMWPGIIGGFLIGVGFIIGGFCPGTSVMAAATGKIDAFFYLGGILIGIVIFGEETSRFDAFYHSSYMGRFMIPDWLGVSVGWVVFAVVVVAIFLLWGSEQLARVYTAKHEAKQLAVQASAPTTLQPETKPSPWRFAAAGILALAALGVLLVGQPDADDLWQRVAATEGPRLTERLVQIHPAELRSLTYDVSVNLIVIDVRDQANFNLFHLRDSVRMDPADLPAAVRDLQALPANTVYILVSNGETLSTAAWKTLTALGLKNTYILEGGINNWISVYGHGDYALLASTGSDETLHYAFSAALGANAPAAAPSQHNDGTLFTPKVELKSAGAKGGGGCG